MKAHPLSDVHSINIGKDTIIWQYAVVLKGAVIGKNCNINCHTFIENDVLIGDNVTVKSGVYLWDGIEVENNVFIGPNVTFTNDLVPRSKQYANTYSRTVLKQGCSIGANATIICGHTIGEYALIGAGSVITKNVPPYSVWYGNPGVHKGFITTDGKMLSNDLTDSEGNLYIFRNNKLELS